MSALACNLNRADYSLASGTMTAATNSENHRRHLISVEALVGDLPTERLEQAKFSIRINF